MTQEEKISLIPQERYANAYIETWTDINGKKHEDFRLVDILPRLKHVGFLDNNVTASVKNIH